MAKGLRRVRLHQFFFRWHRRVGLAAAILIVLLAVTGLALNHTDSLGLDAVAVDSEWILDAYGIAPDSAPASFELTDAWLIAIDGNIYLDGSPLENRLMPIVAATGFEDFFVVSGTNELLLFTPAGELVERMTAAALPGQITRAGLAADGAFAVETTSGIFTADADLITWQQKAEASVVWSMPATPPSDQLDAALLAFRGDGVSLERVLLDLHSGRLFGLSGRWLADATAIALILLAASGITNWALRRS